MNTHTPIMKVYSCTKFKGYWPVGASAVVTAESPERAAELLEQSLAEIDLKQEIDPRWMIPVMTDLENVRILTDGEY